MTASFNLPALPLNQVFNPPNFNHSYFFIDIINSFVKYVKVYFNIIKG